MVTENVINCEKYYNDKNELGILISPGYGAGWSTINIPEIAYDKKIIEFWLVKKPSETEMGTFLKSLGYKDIYMHGYDDLEIEYIPRGTMYCIMEYAGYETIETPESLCMTFA